MARRTVFLSVGDESGDVHASNLMRAMRALAPDVGFLGLGMDRMKAEGMEPLLQQNDRGGAMWLHNVLRVGEWGRRLARCRGAFRSRRPSLVVLIDFGGFNIHLARTAAEAGIPVLYYILPQLWAHGLYRIKKIKKWVTKSLVIYPFEPPLYRPYGLEAQYVGHPLFDELARRPPDERRVAEIRRSVAERIVALFPGSRRQEVCSNLPLMLQSCARIRRVLPDVGFASVCPEPMRPTIQRILPGSGFEVAFPQAQPAELARAAELCITKSGTVTLEIASQCCPMVIFYRLSPMLYFLAKGVSTTPYMGLVNILAGRRICPELPAWRPGVTWLTQRSLELLQDPALRERHRQAIKSVMDSFVWTGASARAAAIAVEML